ncbi:MAG: hypothetical protein Q9160_007059 [Pyrenula sp. 1 TL-2023]
MHANQFSRFCITICFASSVLRVSLATNASSPSAYFAISNTLSVYCYLLDSKNFTGLSAVFTPDVVANFPEPLGVMSGVNALAMGLNQSLFGVESQHLLGSINIEVNESGYHYGQYLDDWIALSQGGGEYVIWKMTARTLLTMGYLVGAG